MKKTKKWLVVDVESGFIYATFPTKVKATKMKIEFETLDRNEGMFADANYKVVCEES